ncbi:MAG: winged helix-turn-helix transcriptional regulator [Chloroflexota bacterium]|nr:winged helix-turn-helix transcriptional regulator [Chloroflexota bacterium]
MRVLGGPVPAGVEYSLTEKGKDFQTVLIAMDHWDQKWENRRMRTIKTIR